MPGTVREINAVGRRVVCVSWSHRVTASQAEGIKLSDTVPIPAVCTIHNLITLPILGRVPLHCIKPRLCVQGS